MAVYPGTLPTFSAHVFGETITAAQMNLVQDELLAIATKLGIGVIGQAQTAPTTTIDYLLRAATDPGHQHSNSSISSVDELKVTGSTVLAHKNAAQNISAIWTFSAAPAITGGFGAIGTTSQMVFGAGGTSPDACSISWGNNTGQKLVLGTTVTAAFTRRFTLTDTGFLGIKCDDPHAPLQFANVLENRKIVLWEDTNNDHQFYGFGVASGVLRAQISSSAAYFTLMGATGPTTSNELLKVIGAGGLIMGKGLTTLPALTAAQVMKIISNSTSRNISFEVYDNSASPSELSFSRSRGPFGALASLTSGNGISTLGFYAVGQDTTSFAPVASIKIIASGTWPSTTVQGADMLFFTALDSYATGPIERLRVTGSGDVLLGAFPTRIGDYSDGSGGKHVLSISGDSVTVGISGYAVLELWNPRPVDGGSTIQGEVSFCDINNTTKRIASVRGRNLGSTANNRGSQIEMYCKVDGGAVINALTLNTTANGGRLGIGNALQPQATLHVDGSQVIRVTTSSVDLALASSGLDYVVVMNSAGTTLTLPPASDAPAVGRVYIIKNGSGSGSITINPGASNALDIHASLVVSPATSTLAAWSVVVLVYVGSNFWRSLT